MRLPDETSPRSGDAVHAALSALARQYDFTLVSDVVLRSGTEQARIDHAVVDRYGLLLLTVQSLGGAALRGADTDARWVVRRTDGSISTLLNPLKVARAQETVVLDALRTSGQQLTGDYVKSAVVFIDTDLEEVNLGPFDRERAVDVGDLAGMLQLRHDFAPNPGDVESSQRANLALLLSSHAGAAGRADDLSPSSAAFAEGSDFMSGRSAQTMRPTVSYADQIGNRRHKRGFPWRSVGYVAVRVAPVALLGCVYWWVMYGGGMNAVVGRIDALSVPEGEAYSVSSNPSSPESEAMQAAAILRLKQDAPHDIVAHITDMDSPRIAKAARGVTVFTWTYLDASGVARTYTMRVASDGSLISMGKK